MSSDDRTDDPQPFVGRRLTKREAEQLVTAVDTATASPVEELLVVVDALTDALRVVVDPDPDNGWTALIDRAARHGAWPADRVDVLRSASRPTNADVDVDVERVLDALWDLVAELNEVRTIAPPSSARSSPE